MNISRTRWIVYLDVEEGFIYCYKAGWVSTNVINQVEASIKTYASKEEAQKEFPDIEHIQFIEVKEDIYT